jgi:hypothetical protein
MATNQDLGTQLADMISGLKNVPLPKNTRSVLVGGESFKVPALVKKLEEWQAYWTDTGARRKAYRDSIQKRKERTPAVHDFLELLKPVIVGLFGVRSSELVEFGLTPKKSATRLSAEERALANARMRSTRKERHTMGRRQKADVVGDVSTVTIDGNGQQAAPANGTGKTGP